ncbi:PF14080 domain protein [Peptostreptococcaceae bacterium AS15]|nr:PF14080 domain protein [Peptostreptococcaceae bacterium AS15]
MKAFGGFVLLDMSTFEKNEILFNLRNMWKININADTKNYKETENMIRFEFENADCVILYSEKKLKDEWMINRARMNYNFENAVQVCQSNVAYITIGVTVDSRYVDLAILFNKIASACLNTNNARAIYCSHNVIEKSEYIRESYYLKNNYLPIENLIYIGFIQRKDEVNHKIITSAYSLGMKFFDKCELEIVESSEDIEKLRNRMLNIAYYIIDNDILFTDEETITISEKDENGNVIPTKYTINQEKAVNVNSTYSLKIK